MTIREFALGDCGRRSVCILVVACIGVAIWGIAYPFQLGGAWADEASDWGFRLAIVAVALSIAAIVLGAHFTCRVNRKLSELLKWIASRRTAEMERLSLDKHGFLAPEMETLIRGCRHRHSAYFELAIKVNEFCQAAMSQFAVHNRVPQEVYTAALYMRALSNYQSVILLCERGISAEARAMLRVMIETVMKLCAIAKDAQLANDFMLEDEKERLTLLRKFRKLHGGQLPPNVDVKEFEQLERQLQKVKVKRRNKEDWAKEAGLHDWYLTAYSVLSASVHSDVKDLERYFDVDHQGTIKGFNWGPDERGMRDNLATAIEGILVGLSCAAALFRLKKNDKIDEFRQQVRELHPPSYAEK